MNISYLYYFLNREKINKELTDNLLRKGDFKLITSLLSISPHKTRNYILNKLLEHKYSSQKLNNKLCKLLKTDSLQNGNIAYALLQLSLKNTKKEEEIKIKNSIKYFEKRKRENDNLSNYRKNRLVKIKGKFALNKNKMVRLEQVRQQLKKPMQM